MRRLGLQGRLVVAGAPAAAGLATTAGLVLAGQREVVDTPTYAGGAIGLAAAGLGLGVAIARRTISALDGAVEAAEAVTPEAVLDDLATTMATGRRPAADRAAVTDPVVGPLTHMAETLTTTAVAAAYQHGAAVRASVTSAVVRLAQRNQELLERQLRLLDDLEDAELDPDGLARLFELDHLATQMRRRNDALVVLGAAGSGEGDAAQVAVRDVLRGALSAVEQYTRVAVESSADAAVGAAVASDIALLLAEVIDNAVRVSPEGSAVHVTATSGPGGLVIGVVDDGPGFTPGEIDRLDATFRAARHDYLPVDAAGLGLLVGARVAARHGLRVSFGNTALGGGRVTVEVPASLVRSPEAPVADPGDAAVPIVVAQARRHDRIAARQQSGTGGAASMATFVDWQPTAPRVPARPPRPPVSDPAVTAPVAGPAAAAPHGGERAVPEAGPGVPSRAGAAAGAPVFRVVGPARSEGASLLGATDQVAVGGLVRRVPGASLRDGDAAPRRPSDEPVGSRDPETVRARLADYRRGVDRGRNATPDRAPHEGR